MANVRGTLPLVTERKQWRAIYAVDIAAFCRSVSSETLGKTYASGLAGTSVATLAGDYEIVEAKPVSAPFEGAALLLRSRNSQDVSDQRPYAVWWFVKLPQDAAGAVRQSIADGKLRDVLHFDRGRPLVPIALTQRDGFTLFAAVTPCNIAVNQAFIQLASEDQADSPDSYAGTPQDQYQAALAHWQTVYRDKQSEWNAAASELRAKLSEVKGKPNEESVRAEVSAVASKVRADKEAWELAHPQPTPQS